MPDFDQQHRLNGQNRQIDSRGEEIAADDDLLMEQILENLSSTPIGQVLRNIACLPEMKKQKILQVRRELTEGTYNLNERLDIALDRVLEDLTT